MFTIVFAALTALFVWWSCTGTVMVLARNGERRPARAAFIAGGVAALCLYALWLSAKSADASSVYTAFFAAVGVWGALEALFLIGILTGPNRAPCPSGAVGWRRFRLAFAAVRDHELSLAAAAVIAVALTWGAPNLFGLWTFLLLWIMRISAKLIIFRGAPNSVNEMMPARIGYLKSYFRTDRVTRLFAVSIALSVAALIFLLVLLSGAGDRAETIGHTLLATLLALAIFEHVLLVLPVSDEPLWKWATPPNSERKPPTVEAKQGQTEGTSWT